MISIPQHNLIKERQQALDLADIGFCTCLADGTIIDLDQTALRILEPDNRSISVQALTGLNLTDYCAGPDQKRSLRSQLELAEPFRDHACTTRINSPTPHRILISGHSAPHPADPTLTIKHLLIRADHGYLLAREINHVFDQTEDLICLFDDKGSLRNANPAFEQLLGTLAQEFRHQSIVDRIHVDDQALFQKRLAQETLKQVDDLPIETRVISKTGEFIWLEWHLINLAEGFLTFAVARNVTDRKRTEEALRASEERFRSLFENSSVGIYRTTPKGEITLANASLIEMLGFPDLSELIHRNLQQEGFKTEFARAEFLEQVNAAGFIRGHEGTWKTKDDQTIYVRESARVVRNPDGQIMYYEGMVEDISDQKLAERKLQQSERLFRNLIENLQEGIWAFDSNELTTYVNPQMLNMLGYSRAEVASKAFDDFFILVSHDQQIEFTPLFNPQQANQVLGILIKKNGEKIDALIQTTPLFTEHAVYEGFLASVTDVTQLREAEQAIKLQLQEKEVLLREIHHRVKNNFQIISSLLSLQGSKIKNQQARDALRESKNRIRVIALIHEKLYQMGDISQIDFKQYANSLVKSLRYSYGRDVQQIIIRVDIERIYFDVNTAIPCAMIINELVSNSLKYGFPEDRSGEILIRLRQGPDGIYKFQISDNGIGFENLWNLSENNTLGLRLVTDFVKQLSGRIELEISELVEFTVTFPLPEFKLF